MCVCPQRSRTAVVSSFASSLLSRYRRSRTLWVKAFNRHVADTPSQYRDNYQGTYTGRSAWRFPKALTVWEESSMRTKFWPLAACCCSPTLSSFFFPSLLWVPSNLRPREVEGNSHTVLCCGCAQHWKHCVRERKKAKTWATA